MPSSTLEPRHWSHEALVSLLAAEDVRVMGRMEVGRVQVHGLPDHGRGNGIEQRRHQREVEEVVLAEEPGDVDEELRGQLVEESLAGSSRQRGLSHVVASLHVFSTRIGE